MKRVETVVKKIVKKKKMEKGEWLSNEEYQRKRDLERKAYLEKELEIVSINKDTQKYDLKTKHPSKIKKESQPLLCSSWC